MESVVRSLMFLHHGLSMLFVKSSDTATKAKCARLFWEVIDSEIKPLSTFWEIAIALSRNKDENADEVLREYFELNFPYYHLSDTLIRDKCKTLISQRNMNLEI